MRFSSNSARRAGSSRRCSTSSRPRSVGAPRSVRRGASHGDAGTGDLRSQRRETTVESEGRPAETRRRLRRAAPDPDDRPRLPEVGRHQIRELYARRWANSPKGSPGVRHAAARPPRDRTPGARLPASRRSASRRSCSAAPRCRGCLGVPRVLVPAAHNGCCCWCVAGVFVALALGGFWCILQAASIARRRTRSRSTNRCARSGRRSARPVIRRVITAGSSRSTR